MDGGINMCLPSKSPSITPAPPPPKVDSADAEMVASERTTERRGLAGQLGYRTAILGGSGLVNQEANQQPSTDPSFINIPNAVKNRLGT